MNRLESALKYFVDKQIKGSILELGAGNGTFANSLLKNDLAKEHYVVTDISENRLTAVKNSIKDSRLDVKNLDLNNFEPKEIGQFDVVVMIAIIEHIINPIETMRNVKKLIKREV